MKNVYNEKANAGLELDKSKQKRLVEYLHLLSSCSTKEDIKRIESLYLDLSDFRYLKRYVPDIDTSELITHKKIIDTILNKNITQMKHVYGENYNPLPQNIPQIKNNNNYSIQQFLEEAVLLKTKEEYELFYKTKYNFVKMQMQYVSPKVIALFTENSEIPTVMKKNNPKEIANLFNLANKNGFDIDLIPTPNDIKQNGLNIIAEKLQLLKDKSNITYHENEMQSATNEILTQLEYDKLEPDVPNINEMIIEEPNEKILNNESETTNNTRIKSLLTDKEFTGENITLAENFEKELIEKNIITPSKDDFLLISKKQAEFLKTTIKPQSPFVFLTIPPNDENQDFHKEQYFHISSVENQDIINQICQKQKSTKKNETTLEYKDNMEINEDTTYNKMTLQDKHKEFIKNPYIQGVNVPSFGMKNQMNNISVFSGYSYAKSEYQDQTIVLSKLNKENKREFLKIPSTLYNTIIQNSLIIAKAPSLDSETLDRYNKAANLDQNNQRINTANNFWHNYKAYCRVHCSNQQEAMEAAKHIIKEMKPVEKARLKEQFMKYQKETKKTYNDRILDFYTDAVRDIKIKNLSPFHQKTLSTIKHTAEVINTKNASFDKKCKMKIGDSIAMNIEVKDLFKNNSFIKLPRQEMILVSSCKENNTVVLTDKKGLSKFVISREDFINKVQKIERKQQRIEKKQQRKEYISYN